MAKLKLDYLITFFIFVICIRCSNYSFSGSMSPGINSIAIPIFDDVSSEFQIREKITNSVIQKFIIDNNLKVVSLEEANSILKGTIVKVEDNPVSLRPNESASAFELYIYVKLDYIDQKSKKIIFQKNLRGRGTYSNPSQRDDGINEAVDKISTDILNLIVSGW